MNQFSELPSIIDPNAKQVDVRNKPIFNKQLKRNCRSLINDIFQIGPVDSSITYLLTSLQKEPHQRTTNDITFIKAFLEKTELARRLTADHKTDESVQQILVMCATEMKYSYCPKNATLFRIGEEGTSFYIIIKGKVEILKPRMVQATMTGFQYFEYIITLYDAKETYLVNQTIESNYDSFPIESNIMPLLKAIMLSMLVDGYAQIKHIQRRKLLNVIETCHINLIDISQVDIDEDDDDYIEDIVDFLQEYLKQVAHIKLDKYLLLKNKSVTYLLSLYENQSFMHLESSDYFGDSALDKKTVRNATIKAIEDTHLCSLDTQYYNNYLLAEKNRLNALEISFLVSHFFFKNISYGYFEKKYFNFFIDNDYYKNEYLCYEDNPADYIFFIRNGQIELTTKKNVFELQALTNYLSKIIDSEGNGNDFQMRSCTNDFSQLVDYLSRKMNNRLYIINGREVIGAESFFYGINYLCTAKVVSKRAKVYKIGIKELMKIMQVEVKSYDYLQLHSKKKLQLFIQRFNEIRNDHVGLSDYKVSFDNKSKQQFKREDDNQIEDYPKTEYNNINYLKGNVTNNQYSGSNLLHCVFKSFPSKIRLSKTIVSQNIDSASQMSTSPCLMTEFNGSKCNNLKIVSMKKDKNITCNSNYNPKLNTSTDNKDESNKSNINKYLHQHVPSSSLYSPPKAQRKNMSKTTFDTSPVTLINETKLLSKLQKEIQDDNNKRIMSNARNLSPRTQIPNIKRHIRIKPKNKKKYNEEGVFTEPNMKFDNYLITSKEETEEKDCNVMQTGLPAFNLPKMFSWKYHQHKLTQYKVFKQKVSSV